MSAHDLSFPYVTSNNRDLVDAELWARSLRRSVHRREITEAARKHAMRRKSAAVAVTASMAAGPVVAPFAAVASAGGSRAAATQTAPERGGSAVSLPSGALVKYGDTGAAVAAVQKAVGVDDDAIFGPITRGAVERFQSRAGLPVTGSVDAKTWATMFRSQVSYVGKGGSQSVTVDYRNGGGGGGTAAPEAGVDGPAAASPKPVTKTKAKKKPTSKRTATAPRTTAPKTSTDAAENRKAITNTQAVANPAPVAAPVTTGAGCGAGQIASPVAGTTTGSFGENRGSHAHAGKDISAPTGTAVRAAQCGTVTKAGWDNGGYGNLVCIEHEGGVSTCYAHLSSVDTKVGQYVHVGDVVGKVGSTGRSTGPHLHFEVRENGKAVNPDSYLSGSKTIAGAAPKTAAGKSSNGSLAVTESGSAAEWGEATAVSAEQTEATLAAAWEAEAAATAAQNASLAVTDTAAAPAYGAPAGAAPAEVTAPAATTDPAATRRRHGPGRRHSGCRHGPRRRDSGRHHGPGRTTPAAATARRRDSGRHHGPGRHHAAAATARRRDSGRHHGPGRDRSGRD